MVAMIPSANDADGSLSPVFCLPWYTREEWIQSWLANEARKVQDILFSTHWIIGTLTDIDSLDHSVDNVHRKTLASARTEYSNGSRVCQLEVLNDTDV